MDYFLQNEMPYSFNMPIPQKKKKKILRTLRQFLCICLAFCSEDRLSSISSHCNFIKYWLFLKVQSLMTF